MSEVSLDNIFFTEGYCASDPQDAQGNEIHRSHRKFNENYIIQSYN
jgi:hypothetical protein